MCVICVLYTRFHRPYHTSTRHPQTHPTTDFLPQLPPRPLPVPPPPPPLPPRLPPSGIYLCICIYGCVYVMYIYTFCIYIPPPCALMDPQRHTNSPPTNSQPIPHAPYLYLSFPHRYHKQGAGPRLGRLRQDRRRHRHGRLGRVPLHGANNRSRQVSDCPGKFGVVWGWRDGLSFLVGVLFLVGVYARSVGWAAIAAYHAHALTPPPNKQTHLQECSYASFATGGYVLFTLLGTIDPFDFCPAASFMVSPRLKMSRLAHDPPSREHARTHAGMHARRRVDPNLI